jgi:glycosyltransferase involved in cell wall biosynthesis
MRSVRLVAGAAGMYCGSCMHDNRIVAALRAADRDAVLVPLYTPIRTDEADVSARRVYCGGLTMFLAESSRLVRHLPRLVLEALSARPLLRMLSRFSGSTQPDQLGPLTVSTLQGLAGHQRMEFERLLDALAALQPGIVHLPNLLLSGLAPAIKQRLGVPVACGLAGEDIFIDRLPPTDRADVHRLIRANIAHIDGFDAASAYYARHAAAHFGVPAERIVHLPLEVATADFDPPAQPPAEPFTIGYLARVCRDKGIDIACHALLKLRARGVQCRLCVAGYRGGADARQWDALRARMQQAGVTDTDLEDVGEVDRAGKVRFLHRLHVLAVPARWPESKGYYAVEALAAGVPVVLPESGAFPELIAKTGGGLLHTPEDPDALADAIAALAQDPARRAELAQRGRAVVQREFDVAVAAQQTWDWYRRLTGAQEETRAC